jgi:hypothetical protein
MPWCYGVPAPPVGLWGLGADAPPELVSCPPACPLVPLDDGPPAGTPVPPPDGTAPPGAGLPVGGAEPPTDAPEPESPESFFPFFFFTGTGGGTDPEAGTDVAGGWLVCEVPSPPPLAAMTTTRRISRTAPPIATARRRR